MMKTGYSLLLATMLCTSAIPLVAAETAKNNASEPTKITQTVQALEHRVSKLESNPKSSFEMQNKVIDRSYEMLRDRILSIETWVSIYATIFTFFFVVAGFVGFRNIGKWVKNKIQEQAKLEIDKMIEEKSVDGLIEEGVSQIVKQKLADFDAELDGIRRLKKLYEELPKYPSESFTKQEQEAISKVEEVAEEKSVDERTEEDWFAIGLKAHQEGLAEEAYQAFKRAMQLEATAHSIGNAAFTAEKAGYSDEAEDLYQKAMKSDPNGATNLGNYANFLRVVRDDHDEAEVMYKRAIEADPNDATSLGNYAAFLTDIRGKHDDAEAMYKRAINVGLNDANFLGNYATFLTDIRGKHDDAEAMYKRAMKADPNDANVLSNYAQMLLAQGRPEGEGMLRNALNFPSNAPDLLVELNFYRLAHFSDEGADALAELKRLLTDGARSKGWDLAPNIERAIKDGHPNPELLQALADVISKDAPLDGLDQFAEWKAA